MKRIAFTSCGLALLFVVATVLAADKKQATLAQANAAIEELTKQIDSLQAKVKGMEQRLAKVEEKQKAPVVAPVPISGGPGGALQQLLLPHAIPQRDRIEDNFADPNNPPKIWGEGQINGWKFYTIPISSNERGTAEPIPVAGR